MVAKGWIGRAMALALAAAQLLALDAIAAAPGRGQSAEAPLPMSVTASGEKKVRGVYAEAHFGDVTVNDDLDRLESDCSARGKAVVVEGRPLQWSGVRQLYRSVDFIAAFEMRPMIVTNPAACTAAITLRHEVKVVKASTDNLIAAGWKFDVAPCRRSPRAIANRCRKGVVAGVSAQCIDRGDGLVGSTACYSTGNDLSRGLEISGSNYTDDGSGPDNSWGFDRVVSNALIDPAIFRAH